MTYRFANSQNDLITDGNGKFIPCVPGNSDYDRIVSEGLLGDVLPYEAPAETPREPTRAEKLEAALVAKGIFTKEEIEALIAP